MLDHDAQSGKVAHDPRQHTIEKHPLAIEHVHTGVGHLAVHAQGESLFLHLLQCRIGASDVGDARFGVCRRARRIVLHRENEAARLGRPNFRRRRVIGKVQRQPRLEGRSARESGEDPIPIELLHEGRQVHLRGALAVCRQPFLERQPEVLGRGVAILGQRRQGLHHRGVKTGGEIRIHRGWLGNLALHHRPQGLHVRLRLEEAALGEQLA